MKYIKHPIPEEISDKGGASVQLVAKQTIPLDGAIDAALEAHYCIGQKPAIMNNVFGALKSMAAGVRRDGRPRRIDGFLGLYPVFKGKVDLAKGFDPAENKVQIKARLLNELVLNTKKWTFEDVTPGKRPFTLDSVKAGSVLFVVKLGEAIQLNGQGMPSTKAGEELRIHWAVEGTDKSGDIPAAKLSSDVGRADIAADALAELASEEYDGKTIVFTVRGNFSSAKISAKLKYVEPVEPVWKYSDELYVQTMTPRTGTAFKVGEPIDLTGLGLTDNATAPLYLGNVKANFNGGETSCSVNATYAADGKSGSWTIEDNEDLEPGTHEGELEIWVIEGGSPNVKTLPLTVVKEA